MKTHAVSMAEALGIETVWSKAAGRMMRRVQCVSCDYKQERNYPVDTAPAQALQNFQNQGWQFTKRGPVCPACQESAKRKAKEDKPMQPAPVSSIAVIPPARNPTIKEVLAVSELLDRFFADGVYLDGYSDERVSKEKDIPRAIVSRIRDEGFGPIKGDPELEAIKADLRAAVSLVEQLQKRVEKIERRVFGGA